MIKGGNEIYSCDKSGRKMADFESLRGANLRLLARVPESDRERVGVHAERGEESVAHMIRMYAGHDLLHLRQVERILAAVRSA